MPGWVLPLVSSVLTGIGTLLAAVLSYRNQKSKITIELETSRARLKELDMAEFRAISEGNKALRDALIERINEHEKTFKTLRTAHNECERRLDDTKRELRRLKERIEILEDAHDRSGTDFSR